MKLIQDSKPKIFPTKNKATHHPAHPTDHLFDQAPCYSLIRYSLLLSCLPGQSKTPAHWQTLSGLNLCSHVSTFCLVNVGLKQSLTLIPRILPVSIFLAPSSWLALPRIHPIAVGESASSDDLLKLFTQDHGWLNNFLEASLVLKTKLRTFQVYLQRLFCY